MRYVSVFLLNLQQVFAERARSFVWFLLTLFGPVIAILFWRGAVSSATNWNFSSIATYYLLIILGSSLLISHIEDEVARIDIQEGGLVSYLLKPFGYFWMKFFLGLPNRLLQGAYGVIAIAIIFSFLHGTFVIANSPLIVGLALCSVVFAYFLSFLSKMCLGFAAFWMTDIRGLYEVSEMLLFIFGGYIVPLYFFPSVISLMAYILPFGYMLYFPIIALEGKLSLLQVLSMIGVQLFWLGVFSVLYLYLWKHGLKKFSGVGQ